mmetsp:Transcript_41751/g.110295  ORF Transcript_41751/g.110295 Transcript_41751/m.110295 type:complete len:232 (+) Transcript_41751:1131-1826(+)
MAERFTTMRLPDHMPAILTTVCFSLSFSKYSAGLSRHHATNRSQTSDESGLPLSGLTSLHATSQILSWSSGSSCPKPASIVPRVLSSQKARLVTSTFAAASTSGCRCWSTWETATWSRFVPPVADARRIRSIWRWVERRRSMHFCCRPMNMHRHFRNLRPKRSSRASRGRRTFRNTVLSIALRPCRCARPPAFTYSESRAPFPFRAAARASASTIMAQLSCVCWTGMLSKE